MVVRFASDGRVFVAEKSGIIKVFSNLSDPTPDDLRGPRTNVHNYWDRGLLGMALAPELPGEPVRLRPLHLRPHARLGERTADGAPRGDLRRARRRPDLPPTDASSRAALAAAGVRQRHDGLRAGLDRGLVPAVPEPLIGYGRVRPRRRALRERRRRCELHVLRLGAGRQSGQPLRRSPGGGRRCADATDVPKAECCAARTCARRATRSTLDGSVIRVDPATGAGLPSNPFAGTATRTSAGSSPTACETRSASRSGPEQRDLDGDVGWATGRRSTASSTRATRRSRTSAGRATRERRRQTGSTLLTAICENLYAQPNADTKPYFAYRHRTRWCPARRARRAARRSPVSPSVPALPSTFPAAVSAMRSSLRTTPGTASGP